MKLTQASPFTSCDQGLPYTGRARRPRLAASFPFRPQTAGLCRSVALISVNASAWPLASNNLRWRNRNGGNLLFAGHGKNIDRYQRLLKTHLTDLKRHYIECRLSEEQAAMQPVERSEPIVDLR
jgi:hypothetical protein